MEQIILRNLCVYTYMYIHVITFSEIVRDNEFEGEGVGVYWRVWTEQREGRNVVINYIN